MKVIQVISSPAGGGAEVLVRELGARVGDASLLTEVIYFNANANSCKDISFNSNETILGLDARNPLAIIKLRQLFKTHLIQKQPLVVHAHLTWPFFYVALASVGLNITLVFTEHDTNNSRRSIPFFKYIERLFYSRYSIIICISEGVRQPLCSWLGGRLYERTKTIMNGARIYNFKPRNAVSNPIHFVSVGSLFEKKGFATSLTALSQLKNIDWTYTLVGDGPLRPQLEELVVKLGIADRVVFSGWSNQIETHLHRADIQLIPSLWEGFGLVAVEGMSTGLPIVASNIAGLREVLGIENPAVFLVDNFTDPSFWVEKIMLCVQSLKYDSEKMSLTARKQVENFTLEKMTENYIAVYKNLF